MTNNPSITIDGASFSWDREADLFLINGMPAVGLLIESTVAGLMWGMQRMVGAERFNLVLQAAGRQSIEGEWDGFITRMPTVEQGIAMMGQITALGGLGRWEVLEFDPEAQSARFRAWKGWEELYQRALGVSWGSSFLAGKLAGYCTRAFGTHCWAEQTAFAARGDEHDEFVVRPSDRAVEDRLEELVYSGRATAADLAAALERLRHEVEERKKAEAKLREENEERRRVEQALIEHLAIVQQQAAEIRALSTPILRVWEGVLAMPVVGSMDAARAAQMMEALLAAVASTGARFTVLDLTGLGAVDTAAVNHMLQLARAASLLGTRCLISGVSGRVARIVVELGVDLEELTTFNTLEAALRFAIRQGAGAASAASAPKRAPA